MGFMDKVKATAEKAAEKAQQGVAQGQQKLSEVQERKRVDGLLRDLGAAVFLDRAGRGSAAITSDIERLLAELREAEASGTTIEQGGSAATATPDGSSAAGGGASAGSGSGEDTPPGSYTLDDL